MSPKEVLALCREKDVKAVDLRFMDFPGLWQHFTIPVEQAGRGRVRRRPGLRRLEHPRLAGDQRERHARGAAAGDRLPRSVHQAADAGHDLQHPGPDHARRLLARSAQRRPQGGQLSQEHRHRRHLLTSVPRPSSSSSTTCASTRTARSATTTSTASKANGTAAARKARTSATSCATRKAISPCRRPTR